MLTLLLLFATGLLAGTVDAIAGGGGLISLPVLLCMGLPPHLAFGTNKLQGTLGTLVAARRYHRAGWITLNKTHRLGLLMAFVGGLLGSVLTQLLSPVVLKAIVPVLLLFIFLYTVLTPQMGAKDRLPRLSEVWFYPLVGFLLGFYDGFFGPGTGSLWVFLLTFFLGYHLIKATGYTKLFNLTSSLSASLCFALGGNIDYRIALVMVLGQLIGGRLGAGLALKQGVKLIRPLFLGVIFCTIVSMMVRDKRDSLIALHYAAHHLLLAACVMILLMSATTMLVFRRLRREPLQEIASAEGSHS
ncbi:MAG TPA: TSUP family transporter [Gammaproteobacteria bacterium]|nr:TSUP family transporter [Gammaproteobacteria bacterium]